MALPLKRFTEPSTGQQVRSLLRDGDPWFVARDVALALGYTNPRDAIAKHVPAHHRGVSRIATPSGEQDMTVIDEPGLYRLIMRSRTADAERFQEWVTSQVLPALRTTGRYEVAPRELDRRTLAQMVIAEADRADAAEQRAADLAPSAGAWEDLADADGDHSVREAAQILSRTPGIKVGQNRLFVQLRDLGWIDGSGQPYQAQVDAGRLVRRTTSYTHPRTKDPVLTAQVRVTPRGVAKLRDLLAPGAQLALEDAR